MKFRMDATLRFWVDVAYDEIKLDHDNLTKQQLIAQILHQYQESGHAMRCLDNQGKIAWKASPRFLTMLADAERDAQDDSGSGDRSIPSNHSDLHNDRSRRNAFVFLVNVFPPAKTASGRRSLYDSSGEARSPASAKRVGRMPGPSGTRCNLLLSNRRFRSRGVVGGGKLCHCARSQDVAAAAIRIANY
jgi:hypothetical protein